VMDILHRLHEYYLIDDYNYDQALDNLTPLIDESEGSD